MPKSLKSRYWFGTIWEQHDLNLVHTILTSAHCIYGVISALDKTEEEHEGKKQDHYHCLLIFDYSRPRPATKTAHWEIAKDTEGCDDYINAKGEPREKKGVLIKKKKGEENWKNFIEACKKMTPKELIESKYSKMYARYRNFAGEISNQYKKLEIIDGPLENEWFYGEAGTGKSKLAREKYPDAFIKNPNKWWDGYCNEETVIIDDWEPKHAISSWYLKIWADRYPFNAEVKGSSMNIRPKRIIITSNYTIDECFKDDEECIKALKRRFKVTHFIGLNSIMNVDNQYYNEYNGLT